MIGRTGVKTGEGEDEGIHDQVSIMIMTFCTWNVKGLGSEEKRWAVKDLVKRSKIGVFSLQETKLQSIDRRMEMDMWGRKSFDFVHKSAIGRLGGILVAWDLALYQVVDHRVGEYSVSVLLRHKVDELMWVFSGVYGSCGNEGNDLLREDLGKVRDD